MNLKHAFAALVIAALFCSFSSAQTLPAPDLSAIVKNLASPDFAQREAAQAALAKLPREEVWAVQSQMDATTDPEVKARLWNALWQMAADTLHHDFATPPAPFKLTARVLDDDGKPIPFAAVSASLSARGFGLTTLTDVQGRFALNVPYDDAPYALRVDGPGLSPAFVQALIPNATNAADTVIRMHSYNPPMQTVQGVVTDDQGRPVANLDLVFACSYGFELHATTGPKGEYAITCPVDALKYARVVVQANDLVPQQQIVNDPKVPFNIQLVKPATMTGIVRERATGKPLADAPVHIHRNNEVLAYQGRTAQDGTYKITGISPGSYYVDVDDSAHFDKPPRGYSSERPKTTLGPGQTATADLALDQSGILMGRILDPQGQPVPRAIVAIISNWEGSTDRDRWRSVMSDSQGRYIIATGHAGSGVQISAMSPAAGMADAKTPELASGGVCTLDVKLPGAARIHGIVTGPDGKPVKDVVCSTNYGGLTVRSAADGSFDFGRISLASSGGAKVEFLPPVLNPSQLRADANTKPVTSPYELAHSGEEVITVTSREKAPPFYWLTTTTLAPADIKAGDATLKVTLPAAHLLTLTGTVQFADGTPAANAEVYVLESTIDPSTWVKEVRQFKQPIVMKLTDSISDMQMPHNPAIAETTADENGRWTIFVLREDLYRTGPMKIDGYMVQPGKVQFLGGEPKDDPVTIGAFKNGAQAFVPPTSVSRDADPPAMTLKLDK